MATEVRTGHILVSGTASGNGIRHGRMGYRCVYDRVACPWFVKEETPHGIIRRRGLRVQRCITINAQQSMLFGAQKGELVCISAFV